MKTCRFIDPRFCCVFGSLFLGFRQVKRTESYEMSPFVCLAMNSSCQKRGGIFGWFKGRAFMIGCLPRAEETLQGEKRVTWQRVLLAGQQKPSTKNDITFKGCLILYGYLYLKITLGLQIP